MIQCKTNIWNSTDFDFFFSKNFLVSLSSLSFAKIFYWNCGKNPLNCCGCETMNCGAANACGTGADCGAATGWGSCGRNCGSGAETCCGCDSALGWVRIYSRLRWIASGIGGGVGIALPVAR